MLNDNVGKECLFSSFMKIKRESKRDSRLCIFAAHKTGAYTKLIHEKRVFGSEIKIEFKFSS